MNIQLTQSTYSFSRLYFLSDSRDPNDKAILDAFSSVFPLKIVSAPLVKVLQSNLKNKVFFFPEFLVTDRVITKSRFVSRFGYSTCTLLIPLRSDLFEVSETDDTWHGKTIGVLEGGGAESFLVKLVKILNLRCNVKPAANFPELVKLWKSGDIDGIFLLRSHPNIFIKKFSFEIEIRFFNFYKYFMNKEKRRSLIQFYFPSMFHTHLALYSYRTFDIAKSIDACSFYNIISADESCDADSIFELIRTIHANFFYFKSTMEFLGSFSESMMKACPLTMSYHAGARNYYTLTNEITEVPLDLCLYTKSGKCGANTKEKVLVLNDRGALY